MNRETDETPLLFCLLPVRNAASYLPGFFESLRPFCDGVISLDDGSTDGTAEILQSEPLVKRVLTQSDRGTFSGWNDAANRNALLRAAGDFQPQWIISLDADELVDFEDGQALREFLTNDAIPGLAYGFRNAPMIDDQQHFLPHYIWVYRLFAYERGLRFPSRRLHFVPIPTRIPPERWVKTTIRIKHLGEMTTERRLARFAKYLEADPARKFQDSYAELLEVVDERDRRVWLRRSVTTPPLLASAEAEITDATNRESVAISMILLCEHADEAIRTVRSVLDQALDEQFEMVVVGPTPVVKEIKAIADDARIVTVPLSNGATGADARNSGIEQSEGTFVAFLSEGETLTAGSLSAMLAAHRRGFMLVEGRYLAGSTGTVARCHERLIWGPQHATDAQVLPSVPKRASYARLALHEAGGFPDTAEPWDLDHLMNQELFRRGYLTLFEPRSVTIVPAPKRWRSFVKAQFIDGQRGGRDEIRKYRQTGGLLRALGPARPYRHALISGIGAVGRFIGHQRSSTQPWTIGFVAGIVLGRIARAAGRWCEILAPEQDKMDLLLRERPQRLVAVSVDSQNVVSAQLVQANYLKRHRSSVPIDPELPIVLPGKTERNKLSELARRILTGECETSISDVRDAVAIALGVKNVDVVVGTKAQISPLWTANNPMRQSSPRARPTRAVDPPQKLLSSLSPTLLKAFAALSRDDR